MLISKPKEISDDLDKATLELIQDFGFFMSVNLVHSDKNLPLDKAEKMKELIKFSNNNLKKIIDAKLEFPITKEIRERLLKNRSMFMKFFHEYLAYAGHILAVCKPESDLFKIRFKNLEKHYVDFKKKHHL
jgi:hypothetical protein